MEEGEQAPGFRQGFREAFLRSRGRIWSKKGVKQNPSVHRSFRQTKLYEVYEPPVYHYGWAIIDTLRMIFKHKRVFLGMILIAGVASVVLVGLMNQDRYSEVTSSLDDFGEEFAEGQFGAVARAGAVFVTTLATGGLNQAPTAEQQLLNVFLMVLVFLATIWAMRQLLLGRKIRLRDALYNAFGPLVPTLLVLLVALVQAIPIFIFLIIFSAATETGFLGNPFHALLFWLFSVGLILLSLSFLVPTVVALVAVTAPGLYPLQALSNADDLMRGRRVQFLFHLFWGLVALVVMWAGVMIPMILVDHGLSRWELFDGWPIVPVAFLVMSLWSVVFVAAYLYLYYRKLIDEFKPKPL
ncbi:hypothetical protein FWH13_01225 [Candidatus Saccharibacteria bacterium]|nr:hypothetical protein [Candidatus Saccharibacteria bacterium]